MGRDVFALLLGCFRPRTETGGICAVAWQFPLVIVSGVVVVPFLFWLGSGIQLRVYFSVAGVVHRSCVWHAHLCVYWCIVLGFLFCWVRAQKLSTPDSSWCGVHRLNV